MGAVIEAQLLSKWYGFVLGLSEVSVEIGTGITALLGPNGAGKTTFLRILTGQLMPSRGRALVFGAVPWANPQVLARIGFAGADDELFPGLSGLEVVTWLCRLRGLEPAEARRRAGAAIEQAGLAAAARRRFSGYSKGMRQRARLAALEAVAPDLYVLDEPTTGVDPVMREQILAWVRRLGAEGKTVLISSHNLDEIAAVTDRMLVMLGGRVRAWGSAGEIAALLAADSTRIEIECGDPRRLAHVLIARPEIRAVELIGSRGLGIVTTDAPQIAGELAELAVANGTAIDRLVVAASDVAGVFRSLTHRRRGAAER